MKYMDVLDNIFKCFKHDKEIYTKVSKKDIIKVLNEVSIILKDDKLILRYVKLAMNVLDSGLGVIINEPWKGLAEQKFYACWSADLNNRINLYKHKCNSYDVTEDIILYIRSMITFALLNAQTFIWKNEVLSQLFDYPIPECIISREILPYPFIYHTFETSRGMRGMEHEDACIDWLLTTHLPTIGIEVFTNVGTREEAKNSTALTIQRGSILYGNEYPKQFEENKSDVGFILSMFAFLKSPYINVNKSVIPRNIRKQERLSKDDCERQINVVELRDDIRERIAHYQSESKEWKHRWWVRGHYRKQWYPSTQSHEMVWIAPYIKGKEELPILEKVYNVCR